MKNNKKWVVIIFIFLLIISSVVYVKVLQSKVYNPYKDFIKTQRVYSITSQLLCPTISSFDVLHSGSYYENGDNLIRTKFTQEIRIFQHVNGEMREEFGKIFYSRDGTAVSLPNDFGMKQGIRKQGFYTNAKQAPMDIPMDDNYYFFYLGLSEPMSLESLFEKFDPFIQSQTYQDRLSSIYWIAIKTSDNPDDIALGITGNLFWSYIGDFPKGGSKFRKLYQEKDFASLEIYFQNAIYYQILTSVQGDSDVALSSGLYGDGVQIDYWERYNYIMDFGKQPLGFVICAKPSELELFRDGFMLLDYIEA